MDSQTLFLFFVIFIAFVFDFINGFHDAANSIATIVTTGVLTPRQAVLWAAFFNFIAFLIFNLTVANTIGKGLIDTQLVNAAFILAALIGAIFWNLLTWYYGLPSSSSHALIGGLTGAAIAKGGFSSLKLGGFIKVGLGILFSPLLGLCIGLFFSYLFTNVLTQYSEKKRNKLFIGFQLASSALLSLTHGANDAQKTMGIIAILLFSASWLDGVFYVPFWVEISCQAVISLGTLSGGWRIVHTMGSKITHLNTMKGCAAETGAALTIFAATEYGVPVSTTHTVTGAIAGVGLLSGVHGAHWATLRKIFLSWLFTIPAAALISAAIMMFII
jgi:PiT family inorganic phosphate transporter